MSRNRNTSPLMSRIVRISRHALLLCTTVITFSAYPGSALSENSTTAEMSQQPFISSEDFEYIIGDRKDPFVPFITERATTADINMNEIVEVDAELTGMQLFEPGQLTLVALLSSGSEDFAMVQDFTGKGYVISKGTKIGKRGVVTEIAPNRVLIEETAQTRAGQKIVTNTVMVLKKEGEE